MQNRTPFVLLFVVLASALYAANGEWKKYANARFGFVLTYPAELIAGEEALNGGGR